MFRKYINIQSFLKLFLVEVEQKLLLNKNNFRVEVEQISLLNEIIFG